MADARDVVRGISGSDAAACGVLGATITGDEPAPAGSTVLTLVAAALFGASYIALSGFALIWSTRLFPDRASYGVGLSFFVLAAGQAVGAPLVGWLIGLTGPAALFLAWAGLSVVGTSLGPRRASRSPS